MNNDDYFSKTNLILIILLYITSGYKVLSNMFKSIPKQMTNLSRNASNQQQRNVVDVVIQYKFYLKLFGGNAYS